jgi:hypothetical protein
VKSLEKSTISYQLYFNKNSQGGKLSVNGGDRLAGSIPSNQQELFIYMVFGIDIGLLLMLVCIEGTQKDHSRRKVKTNSLIPIYDFKQPIDWNNSIT